MTIMASQSERPNYRWYVLALAALTHTFAVAIPSMCMPVLFKEISDDLGLNLVQIGVVWGLASLPGIFTGLVGGSIGDRFGAKRTLMVLCLLSGVAGALRGLSDGFISLTVTILLAGFLFPAIPMNVHKICSIWFSGRQLGLANGVVSTGMALGFMTTSILSATVLSPLLGGWRNVLFLYGAISMALSIPWALTRARPGDRKMSRDDDSMQSFRQSASHLIGIRNLWFLGMAIFGVGGCVQGVLGYLPLYLRGIGWTGASADGALGAFHAISMVFAIPIAMLSDKLGKRRKVLITATLMIIIGVGLLSFVKGTLIWTSVLIAGIVRDGFMAIFMTMIIETKGVGAKFSGTAMGLVMIFLRLGSLLSPPVGNSLADINLSLPFLLWAGLAVVGLIGFSFTREGEKVSASW
jgi:cyanate permease